MADYGLDGSDHGKRKYELKTILYEKRSIVRSTVWTMVWPKVCSVWPLIWTTVWRMVWPTVWTRVWPRVCSVWPLVWTTVWPMFWTTVWLRVCSVCPMVCIMSGQSGQWCPKSVQSGQWWPKSARSGQYLSLGIVGLANACFGYGRSGQYLSWVANFILGHNRTLACCEVNLLLSQVNTYTSSS